MYSGLYCGSSFRAPLLVPGSPSHVHCLVFIEGWAPRGWGLVSPVFYKVGR